MTKQLNKPWILKNIMSVIDEDKYFKRLTHYPSTLKIDLKNKKSSFINILQCLKKNRCIHPALFFIFQTEFHSIGIELHITETGKLEIINKSNIKIKHSKQIFETLRIYYSMITNDFINELFVRQDSQFIEKFSEFKNLYKGLYVPCIEKGVKDKTNFYIDLTFDFNMLITNIFVEINESYHNPEFDFLRKAQIYKKTGNIIILHYLESLTPARPEQVVEQIINQLICKIFAKDKNAGLIFYIVSKGIINNINYAIILNDFENYAKNNELTWKYFNENCNKIGINMTLDFIKKLSESIDLTQIFKNCNQIKAITNKSIMTPESYDTIFMRLTKKETQRPTDINNIYRRYRLACNELIEFNYTQTTLGETLVRKACEHSDDINETCIEILKFIIVDLKDNITEIKEKFNYVLNPDFPILIKKESDKVIDKNLCRRRFCYT